MKRFLLGVLLVAIGATAQAKKMVVAYVPNWIDAESFVKTIDYKKITHINIAFENPIDDDGNMPYSAKDETIVQAARTHKVKVLISIGGGSASGDKVLQARYFSLLTSEKRAGFVSKLADYVVKHQFDGLDVDIEGPSINQNYGAFIDDLSVALKAKKKLLTSALSKGYGGDKVPDSVFAKFDFVNIMAYDGAGPWQPDVPGQHSSFEFAKDNVKYWLDRGLPRSKAVLGVPFYGYGFGDAFRNGDYSYSKIVEKYVGAELVDQVGSTIWYNGIPTIKAKAQHVVDEKLAGVMIWSLDYDVPGEKSLLSALDSILKGK